MKNIFIVVMLATLLGCSNKKSAIREKKISDFQQRSPQKSLAVNKKDTTSNDTTRIPNKVTSKKKPIYQFNTLPSDTFDTSLNNDLMLVIIGEGTAEILLSWQDNSGNWKTVKKGTKKEKIYTMTYSADYVLKNIGAGMKTIQAEIIYNSNTEPETLSQELFITSATQTEKKETSTADQSVKKLAGFTADFYFDDIYFDLGKWKIPSYKFNTNYTITLAKAVKALKMKPSLYLNLTGHTDNSGSPQFNQQLAGKRCYTIGKMVVDFFPEEDKNAIRKRIYINSKGESDPLVVNDQIKNQLNRRVSLVLATAPKGISMRNYKAGNETAIPPVTTSNLNHLYQQALNAFYAKNFSKSEKIFQQIYTKYPTHSLADNAQWWEAEILYVKKDFSKAIPLYNKVFGLGDGNKEAYAQYRVGCCYKDMGMNKKALRELQKVKKLYPNASEEWQKSLKIIQSIQN